jgi:hypothetical protein
MPSRHLDGQGALDYDDGRKCLLCERSLECRFDGDEAEQLLDQMSRTFVLHHDK